MQQLKLPCYTLAAHFFVCFKTDTSTIAKDEEQLQPSVILEVAMTGSSLEAPIASEITLVATALALSATLPIPSMLLLGLPVVLAIQMLEDMFA